MERWRRHLDPEEMTPEERWDEIAELLTIMALPEGKSRGQAEGVLLVLKDDERAPTTPLNAADARRVAGQ